MKKDELKSDLQEELTTDILSEKELEEIFGINETDVESEVAGRSYGWSDQPKPTAD